MTITEAQKQVINTISIHVLVNNYNFKRIIHKLASIAEKGSGFVIDSGSIFVCFFIGKGRMIDFTPPVNP